MKHFTPHRSLSVITALILFVGSSLYGQTYTDLHDFNNSDGCCALYPSLLAQGEDGNIYGATTNGGTSSRGNIFMITPSGTFTNIYNFDFTHGANPQGGISLGLDGNFYGTTYQGGANSAGTVFKITPSGTLTLLYSFTNGTDGAFPRTPPVQAPDGNLYGVTGNGTVAVLYKITPAGTFTIMAPLAAQSYSPLLLGTDGNLYGTTLIGGTFNAGTAFQFVPATKKLKVVHNFDVTTGTQPHGPLMQAADGNLYGTCTSGGSASGGVLFKMSTTGKYSVLYNFNASSPANGASPFAGVVQGSDGFLYGVASVGGANGLGTLFRVSTTGANLTVLHSFATATGDSPLSTPLLHTNGKIYGLTSHGGSHTAYGAFYSLDAGLSPFVSQFVFYSGKVGASVGILGQGFSNATGVKFGTGPGTFVASTDAFMTATVAAGALTGKITVLEPGGNLATPQIYKVIPTISGFTPNNGPPGTSVVITGMSLKQTTSVTFGGVKAASFTVNSDTQVTATVSALAKTGKIGLKTKGGSATSAGSFTVQ